MHRTNNSKDSQKETGNLIEAQQCTIAHEAISPLILTFHSLQLFWESLLAPFCVNAANIAFPANQRNALRYF